MPEAGVTEAGDDASIRGDDGGPTTTDAGALLPSCALPAILGDTAGKSLFLAVGHENVHLLSLDGKTWGDESVLPMSDAGGYDEVGSRVAYGGGTFVVAGPNGLETSTDGVSWSFARAASNNPTAYQALAYLDGTFIALGGNQFFEAPHGYRSTDGVTWTPVDGGGFANSSHPADSGNFRHVYAFASNGSRWVAVGFEGTFAVSDDHGATWHDSGYLGAGSKLSLRGVVWDGGRFVAVGDSGTVVRSSDGIDWSAWQQTFALGDLTNVVFAGGKLVACSLGDCVTSTDATTWTQAFSFDGPSGPLAYANGLFVGLRPPDSIYTSPDGMTWTNVFCQPSGQVPALTDLVFANHP